jgi:hypothetical protein
MIREKLGINLIDDNTTEFYNVHQLIDLKIEENAAKLEEMRPRLARLEQKVAEMEAFLANNKPVKQSSRKLYFWFQRWFVWRLR